MAQGWWRTAIRAGLCAGLLPGCAVFGSRPGPGAKDPGPPRSDRDTSAYVKPRVEQPPLEDSTELVLPVKSPYHPLDERPFLPVAKALSTSERKPGPAPARPADEPQEHAGEHPLVPVEPDGPLPDLAPAGLRAAAAPPPAKKEPLVEALECFLKDEPARALELLKGYQHSSQDVYISLLPVLAQLAHKGVDQLTPDEASAVHERLHSLETELRPRAALVIDKMCFCEHINGFGQYKCLPDGHTFRARSDEQSGEQVMLYIELRNFALAPCPQGYVTRLSSSVEICDLAGKSWWFHSFKPQEPPLYRQAPWHDCFGNYRFYMPHLPPGEYRLKITILDLTRPGPPRQAQQSLPLRVG